MFPMQRNNKRERAGREVGGKNGKKIQDEYV
jgi:hypothetical protein